MQSLASYTAIALDNADAYRQLNEQEHEIRRLFEEAERARAIAEEADAAKSAFLSTVSHELRTPLTSVLGFAKIIKKRLEDRIFPLVTTDDRKVLQTIQQVEDNLRVVVSEGERLTKLIDDVLDLAKIEAGKLEWHMEPVERRGCHRSRHGRHLVAVRPEGAAAGEGDRAGPARGHRRPRPADPGRHQPDLERGEVHRCGTITCRAERRGDELVVSVIDTGMGIAPADQPKVFERFKQVGDTLTDKPKGTGLGLPICREIVEHHGGRIWVESEIGTGQHVLVLAADVGRRRSRRRRPAGARRPDAPAARAGRRHRRRAPRTGSRAFSSSTTIRTSASCSRRSSPRPGITRA